MKLRMVAAGLFLSGALTVAPLQAAGEPAGDAMEMVGTVEPQPVMAEPAAPVAPPRPVDTAGAVEQVVTKAPSPAVSRRETGELPVNGSWWGNVKSTLGLGTDPNPGETVQPAGNRLEPSSDYIIGPGDQVGISVWRDDYLSRTVVVLPDGKISFPLVGEVVAGGKTVAQLKQLLEGKLSRYISDSGVTVEVKQSNSMIIYIIGRVNVPGRQMLLANTNVLQALAMAGGPNPFAELRKIKIFREKAGETVYFPFNFNDVSEGKHLETNIELKRGDVIIVP